MSESLKAAVAFLCSFLKSAGPRVVPTLRTERPTLLFTDGACEEEGRLVTVGAILLSPRLDAPEAFGFQVSQDLVDAWKSRGMDQKQVVGQAELFPQLVARTTWSHVLRHAQVLAFLDNNAASSGLIRGYSPVVPSAEIIGAIWLEDSKLACLSWYDRVPSPSNLADGPSRLDFSSLPEGTRVVEAVLPNAACVFQASLRPRRGSGEGR